jgi:hypothetical protein
MAVFQIFIIYSTISPGAPNGVGNTTVGRGRRIRDGRVFYTEGYYRIRTETSDGFLYLILRR